MRRILIALIGLFFVTSALALTETDVASLRALMDNAIQAKLIRDVPAGQVEDIVVTISGTTQAGARRSASISIQPGDQEFNNAITAIKAVAGRRFDSYVAQMEAMGVTVTP